MAIFFIKERETFFGERGGVVLCKHKIHDTIRIIILPMPLRMYDFFLFQRSSEKKNLF